MGKKWADYELATGESIPEYLRCAVVLKHAPMEIRNVLRRSTMEMMASYATLKDVLETYRIRSLAFQPKDDGGPQLMEVDEVEASSWQSTSISLFLWTMP